MTAYDWPQLLHQLSAKLITGHKDCYSWSVTGAQRASGWLGYSGATEEQIGAIEEQLGVRFPLSYRAFLKVSNGWPISDWTELELWPVEQIGWFAPRNPDFLWQPHSSDRPSIPDDQYFVYGPEQDCVFLRCEYLQTALEISSNSGDGDVFLLIPDVVFPDGEWEAWHLGSKLPGAYRYRSFYELMQKVLTQGQFIE
jgi:hypothetical protein